MDKLQTLFLQALRSALKNEQVHWEQKLTREEWEALFRLAQLHRVLPMIFQAVYRCPAAQAAPDGLMGFYRMQTRQQVSLQTQKTAQFLPLLEELRESGVPVLVVKGIVCRDLYPDPDSRMSGDEDVLVRPEDFDACAAVLERMGMQTDTPDSDSYEVSYQVPGTVQMVELHRSLFPRENSAYADLNRFFEEAHLRAVTMNGIPTLHPTDHILYLILHGYKHFLHSGFGIRQVCDLSLCANAWGSRIDWAHVLECCREVRAEKFAAALFRIGQKYLTFSPEKAAWPRQWQSIQTDPDPLLADILDAGVYGDSDMSRKHSSSITLRAVEARNRGGRDGSLLRTLFPKAKELEGRFPYLKKAPVLLPVAWTVRVLKYGRETASDSRNSPAMSIRIGNDRVALLRRYGILDEK